MPLLRMRFDEKTDAFLGKLSYQIQESTSGQFISQSNPNFYPTCYPYQINLLSINYETPMEKLKDLLTFSAHSYFNISGFVLPKCAVNPSDGVVSIKLSSVDHSPKNSRDLHAAGLQNDVYHVLIDYCNALPGQGAMVTCLASADQSGENEICVTIGRYLGPRPLEFEQWLGAQLMSNTTVFPSQYTVNYLDISESNQQWSPSVFAVSLSHHKKGSGAVGRPSATTSEKLSSDIMGELMPSTDPLYGYFSSLSLQPSASSSGLMSANPFDKNMSRLEGSLGLLLPQSPSDSYSISLNSNSIDSSKLGGTGSSLLYDPPSLFAASPANSWLAQEPHENVDTSGRAGLSFYYDHKYSEGELPRQGDNWGPSFTHGEMKTSQGSAHCHINHSSFSGASSSFLERASGLGISTSSIPDVSSQSLNDLLDSIPPALDVMPWVANSSSSPSTSSASSSHESKTSSYDTFQKTLGDSLFMSILDNPSSSLAPGTGSPLISNPTRDVSILYPTALPPAPIGVISPSRQPIIASLSPPINYRAAVAPIRTSSQQSSSPPGRGMKQIAGYPQAIANKPKANGGNPFKSIASSNSRSNSSSPESTTTGSGSTSSSASGSGSSRGSSRCSSFSSGNGVHKDAVTVATRNKPSSPTTSSGFGSPNQVNKSPPAQPVDADDKSGGGAAEVRQGDWICCNCEGHNFATKIACFTCHTIRPGFENGIPTGHAEMLALGKLGGTLAGVKPGDWTCPKCNENVFAKRNRCYRCTTVRPKK